MSEGLLRSYVRELRQVLGDDPGTPRFIETVSGRGYRFIAPLTNGPSKVEDQGPQTEGFRQALPTPRSGFVGRDADLRQLHVWLGKALQGERQMVFLTGEPGIGKTTLLEEFLRQASARGEVWIGRGQCIEHHGTGEGYLAVLEAITDLWRRHGGEELIRLLGRHAPTWLLQMPTLIGDVDLEALELRARGATPERMLRELAEAVDVLATERPLVLALEDLQWSDYSTLDLLSLFAQRGESARLLVIGTYRPADVIVASHPLKEVKQELQAHGQCAELPLGFLTEAAVADYLAERFPGHRFPDELGRMIFKRTDGNPLFMVHLLDDLVNQRLALEVAGHWQLEATVEGVAMRQPHSLQQLIERQIDRLPPMEQRILEAASVAGIEFAGAGVAAALAMDVGPVEECCERLARRQQFLKPTGSGEWPDGTLVTRYGFLHSLYQQVGEQRIAPVRRQLWHRRIAERGEEAYRDHVGEIATELAAHFELGQDYRRAVHYRELAGERALQRCTNRDATGHFAEALEMLRSLPDSEESVEQELRLRVGLGLSLIATKGYAAPEVGAAYARARALCQRIGETAQLFPVLRGLQISSLARGEYGPSMEMAQQLERLALQEQDSGLLLEARCALGYASFYSGELLAAREHLERGIALYDPLQHASHTFLYGHDPGVACDGQDAWTLWLLGFPDQALRKAEQALERARELAVPFVVAFAWHFMAVTRQLRGEGEAARQASDEEIAVSAEHGFAFWSAGGLMMRGWVSAALGRADDGIEQMKQGIMAQRVAGSWLGHSYWLSLLGDAYRNAGDVELGLNTVAEALALASKNGEHWWEAELYRLQGELLLSRAQIKERELKVRALRPVSRSREETGRGSRGSGAAEREAKACFHKAVELARRRSAKSLELRAAMSLARLSQRGSERKESRRMLAEVYGWFKEGLETADLRAARALLGKS